MVDDRLCQQEGVEQMVKITPDNFKSEILDAKVPVLVDFYADWCGPCRALAPILAELSAEADGRYKIVKISTDEQPDLGMRAKLTHCRRF